MSRRLSTVDVDAAVERWTDRLHDAASDGADDTDTDTDPAGDVDWGAIAEARADRSTEEEC